MYKGKVSRIVASVLATLMCITVLSSCKKEETQMETPTHTTTEATTTVPETVETTSTRKLEPVMENMPEIVFVKSVSYHNQNISGFYITNTGEIKMYDFRTIAPDEIYDIPDVYDRLEEATCSELFYDVEVDKTRTNTEDDLKVVPKIEMIDLYNQLLSVDGTIEYIEDDFTIEHTGDYRNYGIRINDSNEEEIILLKGDGYHYVNSDDLAFDIWYA